MHKNIPLTKGMTAQVDAIDHDFLLDLSPTWCYSNAGYAVAYVTKPDGTRTTRSMHRAIMERILGHPIPPNLVVDHISAPRTGLLARIDNRRDNLRLAERSQNQANKGIQKNTPFGLKGVTLQGNRFRARIKFDRGKQLHLGLFDDPELAGRVYDAASRWLNQEFAGLNFPDEDTTPGILAIVRRYIERNDDAVAYLRRAGQW